MGFFSYPSCLQYNIQHDRHYHHCLQPNHRFLDPRKYFGSGGKTKMHKKGKECVIATKHYDVSTFCYEIIKKFL